MAGAVALTTSIEGLRDSKQLSRRQRERLAADITASGAAVGLGWVTPAEIDAHGLTWAVRVAMERAVAAVSVLADEIIIDGNYNYLPGDSRARAVIKADASVPAVSAASIMAKVARDQYMTALGERYAGYGFARHVGYGTAVHIAALKVLGVSDVHRKSFKPVAALLS